MFLNLFNIEQQRVLITLADLVIQADGSIQHREEEVFVDLIGRCEPGIKLLDNFNFSSLPDLFVTQEIRVALVLKLIEVTLSDREYHTEEKQLLLKVAGELSFDEPFFQRMEAWVIKKITLLAEADDLLHSPLQ